MPERPVTVPEKKLTLFAVRLALLESASSRLGEFAFIWATVIVLGRFFSALLRRDFWLVTVLVVLEGVGIFFRRRELVEWTHQLMVRSTGFPDRPAGDFRDCNSQRRRWHPSNLPLLPWQQAIIPSKCVAHLFKLLKAAVALAGGALSITGFAMQNHSYYTSDPTGRRNIQYALNIFYGLEIAESAIFFFEMAYLVWMLNVFKLFDKVWVECSWSQQGDSDDRRTGIILLEHFFSVSHSKSIKDGIIEGLKVDLVSYAEELLLSDSRDEHLMGAWALQKFVASKKYVEDTLWKIGGNQLTIEKIVDMLNWKEKSELPLRVAAAEILSKLVDKKQHAVRIAAIYGSLVSISLLLYADVDGGAEDVDYKLRRLGLEILNKLVRDNNNCSRIRRTRGLLTQVVRLSCIEDQAIPYKENRRVVVQESLELMHSMASVTGPTGKKLRDDMSSNREIFSNIHRILQLRNSYNPARLPHVSTAIGIFTQLAIDKITYNRIPCLKAFIELLFRIFVEGPPRAHEAPVATVIVQADQAVALLDQRRRSLPPSVVAGKALAEMTSKNKEIRMLIERRYCTAETVLAPVIRMLNVFEDKSHLSRMDAVQFLGNMCSSVGDNAKISSMERLRHATEASSPHENQFWKILRPYIPQVLHEIKEYKEKVLHGNLSEKEEFELDMWIHFGVRIFMLMNHTYGKSLNIEVGEETHGESLNIEVGEDVIKILLKTLGTKNLSMRRHIIELIIWMMIVDINTMETFNEQLKVKLDEMSNPELYDNQYSDDEDRDDEDMTTQKGSILVELVKMAQDFIIG